MKKQIVMSVVLRQEDRDAIDALSKYYRQSLSSTIRRLILERGRQEGLAGTETRNERILV
jgi:hypothetical protein